MIKKILVVFISCVVLLMVKNSFSEVEIKNEKLSQNYERHQKYLRENIEKENHPFTICVRDCFDETEGPFGQNIYSMNGCYEHGDCVKCVDECIEEHDMSNDVAMDYIYDVRNDCFIKELR